MSQQSKPSKSGWYLNESGAKKYWDGENWLDAKPVGPQKVFSLGKYTVTVKRVIQIGVASVVIVGLSITGIIAADQSARTAATEVAAAEELAKVQADAKAKAQAEAAALEAEEAEISYREKLVGKLEKNIKKNAQEILNSGWYSGPKVYWVSCEPISGYLNDLAEVTASFSCFVATEKASGGSYSGYNYDGLLNWQTGAWSFEGRD